MLELPLVSVIIPCYNVESTIESSLKSLVKQTYKNFEVVLVDDGSTDTTAEVIKQFNETSMFDIKYSYQENQGVSVARNAGLKISSGKYVTFLDADDQYLPGFLLELVHAIENNNVDTAFCAYTRSKKKKKNYRFRFKNIEKLNHTGLLEAFYNRIIPCTLCSFIYKKEIIREQNLLFSSGTRYGEDVEFVWRYLTHSNNGIIIYKEMYLYNDNVNSASNNIDWSITDTLKVNYRILEYLRKHNDSFFSVYKNNAIPKTLWSISRHFAINNKKNFFWKLQSEHDVKRAMKHLMKNSNNPLIVLSAIGYTLSPHIFYYVLSLIGKLK